MNAIIRKTLKNHSELLSQMIDSPLTDSCSPCGNSFSRLNRSENILSDMIDNNLTCHLEPVNDMKPGSYVFVSKYDPFNEDGSFIFRVTSNASQSESGQLEGKIVFDITKRDYDRTGKDCYLEDKDIDFSRLVIDSIGRVEVNSETSEVNFLKLFNKYK